MADIKRVEFTKEMKHTHTILVPQMLPIHFQFLQRVLCKEGYHVEVLKTKGQSIIDEGLQNVHNDTCYPALLVIGQMIDALKSGRYDPHRVALAITQTGGGCRASNYIHLLRKALVQAGFPYVPVISVNFSKLEKNSGFKLTPKLLLRLAAGFLYGDYLMWLSNQVKPYEVIPGSTKAITDSWINTICDQFSSFKFLKFKQNARAIVKDYAAISRSQEEKVRVGIVGEIYMKYSPLGNNELESFLLKENCEPIVSGALDFGLYCLENVLLDYELYGRNKKSVRLATWASNYIQSLQNTLSDIIKEEGSFRAPSSFQEVIACSEGMIHRGAKMGEGWLLTAEMVDLIHSGVNNIVCCQPFGCLPNHIVAKGMMRKIKNSYPMSNIVAVDYDPSATSVNQENRLKLMLANARLNQSFQKNLIKITKEETIVQKDLAIERR